jgi:hypothetical protein
MAEDEGSDKISLRKAVITLLQPVPLVALLMIGGVMFLLLSAIFDLDRGRVLMNMGRPEFARGVITYLFTIVTIGTAIVLIISALQGSDKEHFDRGKEVLGLMLGVFGTMVGFYFGSEVSQTAGRTKFALTSPLLSSSEAVAGGHLTVTAFVQGGVPPYHFGIAVGEDPPKVYDQTPRGDGWIISEIVAPDTSREAAVTVTVGASDGTGEKLSGKTTFTAKLKPTK